MHRVELCRPPPRTPGQRNVPRAEHRFHASPRWRQERLSPSDWLMAARERRIVRDWGKGDFMPITIHRGTPRADLLFGASGRTGSPAGTRSSGTGGGTRCFVAPARTRSGARPRSRRPSGSR
jgi:hypothetical protein